MDFTKTIINAIKIWVNKQLSFIENKITDLENRPSAFIQPEEPSETPDGTLWIDIDEESSDIIKIEIDSELNETSENPVQNKIINAAINNLNNLIGDTSVAEQITDNIDITLTQSGMAADAKAVGDAINNIPSPLPEVTTDNNGDILTVVDGEWNIGTIKIDINQADWEQNDSSNPSFIKNKPFYNTEPEYRTIFENIEIIPKNTEYGVSAPIPSLAVGKMLIPGERYKIIITYNENINEYFGIAEIYEKDSVKAVILGNKKYLGDNQNDNGEPYCMGSSSLSMAADFSNIITSNKDKLYYQPGVSGILFDESYIDNTITISLYKIESSEKKIDKRYIYNPDWSQNNEQSGEYIKNRPFNQDNPIEILVFDETVTISAETNISEIEYVNPFNPKERIDKCIIVWDGIRYECAPLYIPEGDVVIMSLGDFSNIEGFEEFQSEQYPFNITAADYPEEYSNLGYFDKLLIQLPNEIVENETHTVQIYKVVKPWLFDFNFSKEVQPDWEETNDSSINYINNKPFYKTINSSFEIFDNNITLTEQTLNQGNIVYMTDSVVEFNDYPVHLIPNETYEVWYDGYGTTYSTLKKAVMYDIYTYFYLGNLSLYSQGEDTGEDFVIVIVGAFDESLNYGFYFISRDKLQNPTVRVSITGPAYEYKAIDERYIPKYIRTAANDVGNLSNLNTTTKDTLVNAINEIATNIEDIIPNIIISPVNAQVGQTIVVKSVDENGKPTEWECVDVPEQVQPDWTQTDETAPDFIKNKPDIATDEDVMGMLSELGMVNPVTTSDGSILTSPTGEIYSL